MVELADGSIIAQLGVTDMRLPIQYAFSYPDRWAGAAALARSGRARAALEFDAPDTDAFPCLRLAYRALEAERSLPVVLNAANEVAVARFLDGRLGFHGDFAGDRAHDGRASTRLRWRRWPRSARSIAGPVSMRKRLRAG